jgi:sporulation protein YunB
LWKRSRLTLSREARSFFLLALFVFALSRLGSFFDSNLLPAILSIAEARTNALAIRAVNEAVAEKFAGNILYQDVVILQKDQEGKIVMAQTNVREVNRLVAETTLQAQGALTALSEEKIYVPFGQALNNVFLAGLGPRIPVTLIPVGFVSTEITDTFEEAGINQVRHKLYLRIQAEVQVAIPFMSSVTHVSTTVPIVDAIYPGAVPDTVINLKFPGGGSFPLRPE